MKVLQRKRLAAAVLATLVALALVPALGAQPAGPPEPGPPQPGHPEPYPQQTTDREGRPLPDFVPGQLIVAFDPASSQAERASVRSRQNVERIEELPLPGVELVRTRGQGSPPQRAQQMRAERSVRYAEPNGLYRPAGAEVIPNDELFHHLWGLRNTGQAGGTPGADTDATVAWTVTSRSEKIVVGVIDSGIMVDHPDLAPNIWINTGELPLPQRSDATPCDDYDCTGDGITNYLDYADDPRIGPGCLVGGEVKPSSLLCAFSNEQDTSGNGYVDDILGWSFVDDNNQVFDPAHADDHGTHVAGTIAAVADNNIGVAGMSRARIMPLKFLGPDGGSLADAVKAIDYAIEQGAHLTNNSWTGGPANSLRQAIVRARNAGQLFVVAAGNDGQNIDSSPVYPASYKLSNMVSVAATDRNDGLAAFSNYGSSTVDMGAPGVQILSTMPQLRTAVLVGPDTTGNPSFPYRAAYHTFGLEALRPGFEQAGIDLLEAALIDWMGIGPTDDVLLVVDTNSSANNSSYAPLYTSALGALGLSVSAHTVSASGCNSGPALSTLQAHDAVLWFTAHDWQCTLTSADRSRLASYLNGGGNLLLLGEDIGYDLVIESNTTFLADMLYAHLVTDQHFLLDQHGVPGTPYHGIHASLVSQVSTDQGVFYDAISPLDGAITGLQSPAEYGHLSGTSMAAPHVAGAAAHLFASYPGIGFAQVKQRLVNQGDAIPSLSGKTISGKRLNLAGALDTPGAPALTGLSVSPDPFNPEQDEAATLAWTQNQPAGITITVRPDGQPDPVRTQALGARSAGGHTWEWDGKDDGGEAVGAGAFEVSVGATDVAQNTATAAVVATVESLLTVTQEPQGDWVGQFGADGYVLAAWEGSTDLVSLPEGISLNIEQARRHRWSANTNAVRALQAPDISHRRAGTYTDNSQVRLQLHFEEAYEGTLRLYATDYDNHNRRQTIRILDGDTTHTAVLDTNFRDGRWVHAPISVAPGGAVVITIDRDAGPNVVLSGIFLGGS